MVSVPTRSLKRVLPEQDIDQTSIPSLAATSRIREVLPVPASPRMKRFFTGAFSESHIITFFSTRRLNW